jgi:hypothetical protein
VTEHRTTVLTDRLHRLADDITPTLDVVGQVRAARAGHARRRRTRITVLAVATATVAVIVGTTAANDLISAAHDGQVAGPGVTTTEAPVPETTAPEATDLAGDWEPRTFQGVTFAVPPGARMADVENDVPVSSWTDGPSYIWNGPHLGGDAYSSVSVTITEPFEGGLPPREGGRWFSVPGAEKAYGNIEYAPATRGGPDADRTIVWLEMLAGDRVVQLDAAFAAGPEGEQMAQDLVDSISVG